MAMREPPGDADSSSGGDSDMADFVADFGSDSDDGELPAAAAPVPAAQQQQQQQSAPLPLLRPAPSRSSRR